MGRNQTAVNINMLYNYNKKSSIFEFNEQKTNVVHMLLFALDLIIDSLIILCSQAVNGKVTLTCIDPN